MAYLVAPYDGISFVPYRRLLMVSLNFENFLLKFGPALCSQDGPKIMLQMSFRQNLQEGLGDRIVFGISWYPQGLPLGP